LISIKKGRAYCPNLVTLILESVLQPKTFAAISELIIITELRYMLH